MRKMKLALDDLAVESFAPGAKTEPRGTVQANQESGPYTDECQSCGVVTGCGGGGYCNTNYGCNPSGGCQTATCYGYQTCGGVYTCDAVDTCFYPQCTGPGAAC
jgi:hypothetical protein